MTRNKGVTVYTPTSGGRDWYPEGFKIHIADGHLHVLDGPGKSIAIYAPGRWHYAAYSEGGQE